MSYETLLYDVDQGVATITLNRPAVLNAISQQMIEELQAVLDMVKDEAGVRSDEPVLLVGHSLGGMAAAAILAGNSGYHVTDVVTAGSPTAQSGRYAQHPVRGSPAASSSNSPTSTEIG